MKFATTVRLFGAAAVASLLLAPAAQADSGFYLGASVGDTSVDLDDFSESDTSWKAFGGYIFDLPVVDFAVEAAYIDFGAQSGDLFQVPAAIDSTGLGELVGAHKAVQRRGDRLHLVATNERVTRLLSLTGLDEVLDVHADRFEALAAVSQS
mgnify:CR=1 FL=1